MVVSRAAIRQLAARAAPKPTPTSVNSAKRELLMHFEESLVPTTHRMPISETPHRCISSAHPSGQTVTPLCYFRIAIRKKLHCQKHHTLTPLLPHRSDQNDNSWTTFGIPAIQAVAVNCDHHRKTFHHGGHFRWTFCVTWWVSGFCNRMVTRQ
jgi:hypothetical protein